MPNLALSQATATAHFDRWLHPDRMAIQLMDLVNLYTIAGVYVRQDGGFTTAGVRQITSWSLTGAVLGETGRNTDASGRLYVRITANGGNWDIHVYKALAAASEVMTATAVAAGATATLAAANSSGLSGTCVLGASPAAIANDTYSLQLYLDWPTYLKQVADGTQAEDGEIRNAVQTLVSKVGATLKGLVASLNRINEGGAYLQQMRRIWQAGAEGDAGFLAKSATADADGTVTVTADGAFERMRYNWAANTTVQKVAVNTIAAASATEQISGGGDIAVTFGTPGPNLEPGLLEAVCVEATLPDQKFRVTFTPTDGTGQKTGKNLLVVGAVWDDPEIPIQISAVNVYALVDTNGDGVANLAAASNFSFQGVTSDNTDDGLLYWTITASGGSWIVAFYSDSSRTLKVAQSPATATGAVFTATPQNRSGLTVTGKVGSGPTTTRTGTMDMQPLKAGTSTTAPDKFTSAITRSAHGIIQDCARDFHGWKLNDGGSPTFPDTFLAKGAQFIDGNP